MNADRNTTVAAGTTGGILGGIAGALLQVAIYYLTPVVPADIQDSVFFLVNLAITGACSGLGAYIAGKLAPPR